jgi:uncharacterized protein YyaL (SSP411 family)
MKSLPRLLAASIAALVLAAAARAADWTEDYASAVARAKKENKVVLLDFTGSDWCVWCQKTDKEVFDTAKFKDFADRNLVLVKVDFPREKAQPDAVKAQNDKLQKQYNIEGFPTLIAVKPDGTTLFTQVGYRDGGPDALIAQFPKS